VWPSFKPRAGAMSRLRAARPGCPTAQLVAALLLAGERARCCALASARCLARLCLAAPELRCLPALPRPRSRCAGTGLLGADAYMTNYACNTTYELVEKQNFTRTGEPGKASSVCCRTLRFCCCCPDTVLIAAPAASLCSVSARGTASRDGPWGHRREVK